MLITALYQIVCSKKLGTREINSCIKFSALDGTNKSMTYMYEVLYGTVTIISRFYQFVNYFFC